MFDIYRRVAELVEEEKQSISMEKLFVSQEYARYIRRKSENVISGTFYNLRKLGFNVTRQQEDALIRNLTTEVMYNPKDETTASTSSNASGTTHHIVINAGCELVTEQRTREDKHRGVLGLLYHELGHVLFSDFPTSIAWKGQLMRGQWFPQAPAGINTVNGINLTAKMSDSLFLEILAHCADHIDNCIEDGYIEREMKSLCPGNGADCINTMNDILLTETKSLEEDVKEGKKSPFLMLLSQVLLYSLFEECKLGDYDGPLLDALYECLDAVDSARLERDPSKRVMGTNELLCVLFPYLEKDIEDAKKKYEQNQQNQQNAQKQGSGQAQGQGQEGIPQAVADAIKNEISAAANQAGASSRNEGCSSSALNNPALARNVAAPTQQNPSNSASAGGGHGAGGSIGQSSLEAARQDIARIMQDMAEHSANNQAEKERTAELNREGNMFDCSEMGLGRFSVSVERACDVPEENILSYNSESAKIAAISRDLQRDIKRTLKDRRESGKRKNLAFGRRFEITSVVHNDGKYFSRNKLPVETPRLSVGLLVDESGSTQGKLIEAAMLTSLVIEDFCRSLDIPHLIYGFTSGANDARVLSYAEPHEIDDGNRFRITGMQARGGTPTAAALAFMIKRMKKLPADIRLIIVITDGESDNRAAVQKIISSAIRDKTIIIAAGIGKDRKNVEQEFGESSFMDISDLEEMPEQLVRLIKAKLWV